MGLLDYAKLELTAAGFLDEEKDFYGGETGKAVLELIEVFAKQGHSGSSASIVISLFKKLASFEPLMEITGEDEEWGYLGYDDEMMYQNKRCSGMFKYKDGTVTYSSGIVKVCPDGSKWTGPLFLSREDAINGVNRIRSCQIVKEFPFSPKTFYIDVIEEEVEKDDWIMWAKDPQQLEEVWQYYKRPEGF